MATLNDELRNARLKAFNSASGTVLEKTTKVEAETSSLLTEVEKVESEIRYWRNIGKLIENKISLAQSILSNIGSQIKAGMYFNDIK